MKFLNLNALQTYLALGLGIVGYFLIKAGCTGTAEQVAECSKVSIITPEMAGWLLAGVTFIKTVIIPAIQPGGWFRNLFEPKVPVSTSGATGTVSKDAVN